MKMTWFSDKLGKKYILEVKTRPERTMERRRAANGMPVKVIGFHGGPDLNYVYYTVQLADGRLVKAYESELTVEVDNPISKEELAAYNVRIIEGMKEWIEAMEADLDPMKSLLDKAFLRGYLMALQGMRYHIGEHERARDNAISKDKLDV